MTTPTRRRPDNLLGICNAVGEDWGFNPLFLRLALAAALLLDPEAALAAYVVLGVAVLVSRALTRPRRRTPVAAAPIRPVATLPALPAPQVERAFELAA